MDSSGSEGSLEESESYGSSQTARPLVSAITSGKERNYNDVINLCKPYLEIRPLMPVLLFQVNFQYEGISEDDRHDYQDLVAMLS